MTRKRNITFGSEIARLRRDKGLLQSEFGRAAEVSGDYISKIESGNEAPADDTGAKLIDFLTKDKKERERLRTLLEIATKQRGKNKPYEDFGKRLSDILKSIGMSQTDLQNDLKDTSIQAVHRIVNGYMMPSPTLMQEIVRVLRKRGADPTHINAFRIARWKAVFLNDPHFSDFTASQLKRLIDCLDNILD
jgi:transcriptional regulator with XRE-family HTH domain